MARKANAKKNYPKTKPALLVPFANNVATLMTGNERFPDPTVKPVDLTKSANALGDAFMNRKNGLLPKEVLKKALAATVSLLGTTADYVSQVAEGNGEIIASAGFDSTKVVFNKSVVPQTPKAPVPENVNGELSVRTERVKGATSYCWIVFVGEAFPVNITNSQIDIDTKAKVIIVPAGSTRECVRGLARGTEVTVQVLAQNAAGKSGLSAAVSIGIA